MSESAATEEPPKKTRPRLDRKVFGLVLGTLQKASHEDKLHRASDAAKKRQQLETRLASKLRNETATVQRKEDARRSKVTALRREEEWGVRDSVAKLRRKRIPLLAEFLCTAGEELNVKRGHPPPVYYLPKVLLPEQEEVLERRRAKAKAVAEDEWEAFRAQKEVGIREIKELRKKVSEGDEEKESMDVDMDNNNNGNDENGKKDDEEPVDDPKMDDAPVERQPSEPPAPTPQPPAPEPPAEKTDEPMHADDDEVEY